MSRNEEVGTGNARGPRKKAGLRGRIFYLSPRDSEILDFLWKWKAASTATLHEAVGHPSSPYSMYKAMERLAQHKYVEAYSSSRYRFTTWQLTDLGFETIREGLGDLAEEGFLSENHWHDRNVLAFHLGEWANYRFPVVSHFTEQEMRRRSVDYYPLGCHNRLITGQMATPRSRQQRKIGFSPLKSSSGQRAWRSTNH